MIRFFVERIEQQLSLLRLIPQNSRSLGKSHPFFGSEIGKSGRKHRDGSTIGTGVV